MALLMLKDDVALVFADNFVDLWSDLGLRLGQKLQCSARVKN